MVITNYGYLLETSLKILRCLGTLYFQRIIAITSMSGFIKRILQSVKKYLYFSSTQLYCCKHYYVSIRYEMDRKTSTCRTCSNGWINIKNYFPRMNMEALEIYQHKSNINRKEETPLIHRAWRPLVDRTLIKTSRSGGNISLSTINNADAHCHMTGKFYDHHHEKKWKVHILSTYGCFRPLH